MNSLSLNTIEDIDEKQYKRILVAKTIWKIVKKCLWIAGLILFFLIASFFYFAKSCLKK